MTSPLTRLAALLICLLLPASYALGEENFSTPRKNASAPDISITMDVTNSTGSNAEAYNAVPPPSALAFDGFFAAAFHSEYGDTQRDALIRWEIPLYLFVKGSPTQEDTQTLQTLLKNLKSNVPSLPDMSFAGTETEANVVISFVPFESMAESLVSYEDSNWGFMNCFSDDASIRYGVIAVASDVTGQKDRNHLIQEEFVNMLGLTADLDFAQESIIYQPYTVTQTLAQVDYEMLSMLYGPYMTYGMNQEEAKAALKNIYPDR